MASHAAPVTNEAAARCSHRPRRCGPGWWIDGNWYDVGDGPDALAADRRRPA